MELEPKSTRKSNSARLFKHPSWSKQAATAKVQAGRQRQAQIAHAARRSDTPWDLAKRSGGQLVCPARFCRRQGDKPQTPSELAIRAENLMLELTSLRDGATAAAGS
jgi:hypothetical protein